MPFDARKWALSFHGIVDENFAVETDLFQLHIFRKEGIKQIEKNSCKDKLDIYLPQEWDMATYRYQEKLRKVMKEEVKERAETIFQERTDFFASRLNLHYQVKAHVTDLGNYYGLCNNVDVKFNFWTICGLPKNCIDYLVCHELAHLFKHGHYKPFWRIVDMILQGLDDDTTCTGQISYALDREMRYHLEYSQIRDWGKPTYLKYWFDSGMAQKDEPFIKVQYAHKGDNFDRIDIYGNKVKSFLATK